MKLKNIDLNDIELLAPVGNLESLSAAINAGANSVYLGVGNLNMRAKSSSNFSIKDLEDISKKCKKNKVKCYLTINTIIYDDELEEVEELLETAKELEISAIIASDVAVMELARQLDITVHISVQANISNSYSVKFFSKYADAMILARELNLYQIKKIYNFIHGENRDKKTVIGPSGNPIKLEAFIHGALCISISGKCFISLHTSNNSANRGRCIQNCRRKYRIVDEQDGHEFIIEDGNYLMSPKDIAMIYHLDKLLESGIKILKIEGRGRSADYVYTVTKTYREALNSIYKGEYNDENKKIWAKRLEEVFNRGLWYGGYYMGAPLDKWGNFSKNQSIYKKKRIGVVTNYYSKIKVAEVKLREGNLKIGDDIFIIGKTTGVLETSVNEMYKSYPVEEAKKGDIISIPVPRKVRKNDQVYIKYIDILAL